MQELTVQVILLDKYSLNKILSICKTQRVSTGSETHVFHFIVDFFLLFMSGITLQNMVKIWLALTCYFDILLYLQYFKCLLKNLSCLKLKFSKTYTNIRVHIYVYMCINRTCTNHSPDLILINIMPHFLYSIPFFCCRI